MKRPELLNFLLLEQSNSLIVCLNCVLLLARLETWAPADFCSGWLGNELIDRGLVDSVIFVPPRTYVYLAVRACTTVQRAWYYS